jgi:hypothetical protein
MIKVILETILGISKLLIQVTLLHALLFRPKSQLNLRFNNLLN